MDFLSKVIEMNDEGAPYSIGVVIGAQGSTPQRPGSRALLTRDGLQWGTLGGGLVEAQSLERMRQVLEKNTAQLFEYRLDESYSREAGPICGGVMRIFAKPGGSRSSEAYAEAKKSLDQGHHGVLLMTVAGSASQLGETRWIRADQFANGASIPAKQKVMAAFDENTPTCVKDEVNEYFVDPMMATPSLLVVGGGHVGQEVVRQAVRLGFNVTVSDDRQDYARPELFPEGVQTKPGDIAASVKAFPQNDNSYIILVSKGHRPDAEALEACIHGDAKYIGMIGSRRKIRFLRKHFIEDGLATAEEFDRVVAPIGFDIGAVTVPEIGVSIAAQLIAARRLARTDCRSMNDPARAKA